MKFERISVDEYRKLVAHNVLATVRANKMGNTPTEVDGILFASKTEAACYGELKLRERIGEIRDLRLQPKYLLQEAFTDSDGIKQRAIHYIADFEYYDTVKEKTVVVDAKGRELETFKVKAKLFRKRYPELKFVLWKE